MLQGQRHHLQWEGKELTGLQMLGFSTWAGCPLARLLRSVITIQAYLSCSHDYCSRNDCVRPLYKCNCPSSSTGVQSHIC